MADELLFNFGDLSAVLRSALERMKQTIENYSPQHLQAGPVDVLVEQFVRNAYVEPLVLDEGQVKPEQRTTKVDVGGRFDYGGWDDRGPVMVDGIEVTLRVPFRGDRELIRLRPSTFNFNPPRGRVIGSEILLSASGTAGDAERIKSHLEGELASLKQYAGWSRGDVQSHNAGLASAARTAVDARRQRLASIPDVASTFTFGKK